MVLLSVSIVFFLQWPSSNIEIIAKQSSLSLTHPPTSTVILSFSYSLLKCCFSRLFYIRISIDLPENNQVNHRHQIFRDIYITDLIVFLLIKKTNNNALLSSLRYYSGIHICLLIVFFIIYSSFFSWSMSRLSSYKKRKRRKKNTKHKSTK